MLTVKNVFHLPNRAAEGFVRSLFALLKVSLCVPDHTTLSRRGETLKVKLPKKASGHLDIVMDSACLKIYDEGKWNIRPQGKSKRRTWRKLHLGVDAESGEFQAGELTEAKVSDDAMVEPLLEQIDQPIDSLAADKRKVYDSVNKQAPNAKALIPPRKNARIWQQLISRPNALSETKICVTSASNAAKPGRTILVTMSVPWQKLPCFASKPSLAMPFLPDC